MVGTVASQGEASGAEATGPSVSARVPPGAPASSDGLKTYELR